jgi:hypothetical protein
MLKARATSDVYQRDFSSAPNNRLIKSDKLTIRSLSLIARSIRITCSRSRRRWENRVGPADRVYPGGHRIQPDPLLITGLLKQTHAIVPNAPKARPVFRAQADFDLRRRFPVAPSYMFSAVWATPRGGSQEGVSINRIKELVWQKHSSVPGNLDSQQRGVDRLQPDAGWWPLSASMCSSKLCEVPMPTPELACAGAGRIFT